MGPLRPKPKTRFLAWGPDRDALAVDAEIVDLYDGILESQHRLLVEWDKTVIEESDGRAE
jgi:hypothetical protein